MSNWELDNIDCVRDYIAKYEGELYLDKVSQLISDIIEIYYLNSASINDIISK